MADNQTAPRPMLTDESFIDPAAKDEFVKRQQLSGISRTLGIGQKPQPKDWEDVARSSGAAVANAPAVFLGTPGDIYQAGKQIESRFAPRLDVPPKGAEVSGDVLAEGRARQKAMELQKAAIEKTSPFNYLPTSETLKGITEKIIPAAGYKSETPEGEKAGQAVSFGAQLVGGPGGLLKAGERFVKGAIGSLAGQEASEAMTKGTSYEPYAEPFFEIGGTALAGGVSGLLRSISADASASKKITDSLAQGFRNGKTRMTPEQIRTAIDSGTPISIADIADPQTRQLIEYYSSKTGKAGDIAAQYNASLPNRFNESQDRVQSFLARDIVGRPIDAPAITRQIEKTDKKIVDSIYDLSRTDPAGTAVYFSQIGGIGDTPILQQAMTDAANLAKNRPDRYVIPGLDAAGSETAGNLSYWDLVKRQLDEQANKLYIAGDKTASGMVKDVKRELVDYLDNRVPTYKMARDVASEAFDSASAPEAGMRFFGRMDDFDRAEARTAFAQYTPEQRDLFKHGWAHELNNQIREGKIGSLSNKFLKDQNFQDNARLVLGDEQFNAVKGKIIAENIQNSAKQIVAPQINWKTPTASKFGAGAALVGAAYDQIANAVFQASMIAPEKVGLATVTGLTAAGAAGMSSVQAKRIANQLLPLVTSTKAEDVARLAKLAADDPRIADILYRTNVIMQQSLGESAPAREGNNREGRATGGKVGSEIGAKIVKLMQMADAMHKSHTKDTEQILNVDDNTVAKALAVANKGI